MSERLLGAIARLARDLRRGTVLDLPGASGAVRSVLEPLGFRVVAGDLFKVAGSPMVGRIVQCDMAESLPLRTASVDHAVCCEGIEHISDAFGLLREFARVIRCGGALILTTPNTLKLRARMAFLLGGQLNLRSALDEASCFMGERNGRIFHGHVFLRSYFQLRYLLHHAGFRIRALACSRVSPTAVMLSPLVPLVWLATARVYQLEGRRRSGADRREIIRHALSPAMLYSKNLVLLAERVGQRS
ncbi:MAG: class I SAM-dependent methyltransferase [Deltaproteobacteria bacterium]|nr:class I SAM-dependent methyltransferase [Deltaproteobacteria bacterium]